MDEEGISRSGGWGVRGGWMGWGWLWGEGWVDGGGGGWGVPPHTCMHGKHGNFMQMATPIGFGEILGIPYDVIHACVRVHVRACVCM